jgi:hypothetical protein
MRNWILILLAFVLAFFLYWLFFISDIQVKRHLKYAGCKIEYKRFFNNYPSYRYEMNYQSIRTANNDLMRCLCKKYMISQDRLIQNYILDFYQNNSENRYAYFKNVLNCKPDSALLMQHCEDIFQDDPVISEGIKYNKSKDLGLIYKDLATELKFNDYARSRYFEYHDEKFHDLPPIDSITKNRNKIFIY